MVDRVRSVAAFVSKKCDNVSDMSLDGGRWNHSVDLDAIWTIDGHISCAADDNAYR
jgi:hypothetical protein